MFCSLPGAKVSILFTALGQRSVSNCFAPCLGVKVNQCFVFCLGTKVSKFCFCLGTKVSQDVPRLVEKVHAGANEEGVCVVRW